MLVVGLTGNYGMGKSSVSGLFRKYGAITLDSDDLVAELLKKKKVIEKISLLLGPQVLNSDKTLNKRAIADIIFQNKTARKKIEALLHPLVFRALEVSIKNLKKDTGKIIGNIPARLTIGDTASRGGKDNFTSPPLRGGDRGEGDVCGLANDRQSRHIVIVEVPLLFEGGFQKQFDRTITVYTNQKNALVRLRRKGVPLKDALARLHAQMDIRDKKRHADYVINNNGTKQQLMAQVKGVYNALLEK